MLIVLTISILSEISFLMHEYTYLFLTVSYICTMYCNYINTPQNSAVCPFLSFGNFFYIGTHWLHSMPTFLLQTLEDLGSSIMNLSLSNSSIYIGELVRPVCAAIHSCCVSFFSEMFVHPRQETSAHGFSLSFIASSHLSLLHLCLI